MEGKGQGGDEAIGGLDGIPSEAKVFAEHDELVAAETSDRVVGSELRPETISHGDEEFVCAVVAVLIHFPGAGWNLGTFGVAFLPGLALATLASGMGAKRA